MASKKLSGQEMESVKRAMDALQKAVADLSALEMVDGLTAAELSELDTQIVRAAALSRRLSAVKERASK